METPADSPLRRRSNDTSITHRVKERAFEIFAQYSVMGLVTLILLVGGGFYFKNAEDRSRETFQIQQKQIERQNEAFIDVVRQQASLVQQTNQVVENNTNAMNALKTEVNSRLTSVEGRMTNVEHAVKDLSTKKKGGE